MYNLFYFLEFLKTKAANPCYVALKTNSNYTRRQNIIRMMEKSPEEANKKLQFTSRNLVKIIENCRIMNVHLTVEFDRDDSIHDRRIS